MPTHTDFPWERDQRKRAEDRRRSQDTRQRPAPRGAPPAGAALAEARRLQAVDLVRGATSVPPPPPDG